MYGFIYEWTNLINGKKYIGSHVGTLEDGYIGSGKAFRHAIRKYGLENFSRDILERVYKEDRKFLLGREKFYLDCVDAYHSALYYNIAKDVIGGDTKAGWSVERRQEFSNQIKQIWANRTDEEKQIIRNKQIIKTKEWYQTTAGAELKEQQRNLLQKNMPKIIEAIKARDLIDRKRSAQLGKERMGAERRKEAAMKGVANRDPITEANAKSQAAETRKNWSKEKRQEVFDNSSKGRKGKCTGAANGRARRVVAESIEFDTFNAAMTQLNMTEGTLRRKLKDPQYKNYFYII